MYQFQLYIYPATSVVNYVKEDKGKIIEDRNPIEENNGTENVSTQHHKDSTLADETLEAKNSLEPVQNLTNNGNYNISNQDFFNSSLVGEKDKSILGEVDKNEE